MNEAHVWPPLSTHSGPHVLRVRPAIVGISNEIWTAAFAENLIADLYTRHDWQILRKRFRMRGSEIDLAVMQPNSGVAKIIEVKLRKNQPQIDFNFANSLLPAKKIEAIRRGSFELADRYLKQGLKLDWSFDMVLVTPDPSGNSCIIRTWTNAVEFG
jgi:Holliday junction resolvase-like predicted endonuclease